jgi:hypothetical protein
MRLDQEQKTWDVYSKKQTQLNRPFSEEEAETFLADYEAGVDAYSYRYCKWLKDQNFELPFDEPILENPPKQVRETFRVCVVC